LNHLRSLVKTQIEILKDKKKDYTDIQNYIKYLVGEISKTAFLNIEIISPLLNNDNLSIDSKNEILSKIINEEADSYKKSICNMVADLVDSELKISQIIIDQLSEKVNHLQIENKQLKHENKQLGKKIRQGEKIQQLEHEMGQLKQEFILLKEKLEGG